MNIGVLQGAFETPTLLDVGLWDATEQAAWMEAFQQSGSHAAHCTSAGLAEAAHSGMLPAVQQLRLSTGFGCTTAARYGHLEILQWLRAQNCP